MASRDPRIVNLSEPLTEYEIRYLRKMIRYRLHIKGVTNPQVGTRTTLPPLDFPEAQGGPKVITRDRAAELDQMADWFLQKEA